MAEYHQPEYTKTKRASSSGPILQKLFQTWSRAKTIYITSFWEVSIPDKMLKQFSVELSMGLGLLSEANYPHAQLPTQLHPAVNQRSTDL